MISNTSKALFLYNIVFVQKHGSKLALIFTSHRGKLQICKRKDADILCVLTLNLIHVERRSTSGFCGFVIFRGFFSEIQHTNTDDNIVMLVFVKLSLFTTARNRIRTISLRVF